MKKIILLAALLSSVSLLAQNHNGYIVKLKDSSKSVSFPKSVKTLKTLSTSFGTFAVVKTMGNIKTLTSLKSNSNIEYIEPNWIIDINSFDKIEEDFASDSGFAKQWGLKNTGKNSGGFFSRGKAGEDINAEKAWSITKGSKEIIVAVIDTGIDYRHPDLKNNLWVNDAELNGEEGIDDDGNGYIDDIYGYDFANQDGDPLDGHSHGTHCAGNIGAVHNGLGIMGVMASVKLMGIKFLTDSGSGETIDAISSIEYAIKNGANIMSNSWGGGGRSEALKEAIVAAKDANILFVAAAGNSYSNNDTKFSYPANYKVENIITVGAMDGKGKKASFSNYGEKTVHVFAPGVGIYSTVKNGKYKKMSGTSMATPIVSGVLGLLLVNEPGISFLDAKKRLMSTTVDTDSLDGYSVKGRVDAFKMLINER